MATKTQEKDNELLDSDDASYVDASSVAISVPGYTDASSLPVSALLEAEGFASCSSISEEEPYVDVASTNKLSSGALEVQQIQDASETADKNWADQSRSAGDTRHVYFELEKQWNSDSDEEGSRYGDKISQQCNTQTVGQPTVNVAERADVYERSKAGASPGTQNHRGQKFNSLDAIYEIPPHTITGNVSVFDRQSTNHGSVLNSDENIYEINFGGDNDVAHQSGVFQNSLEGASVYEVISKPAVVRASTNSDIYELAKPLEIRSESDGSSLTAPVTDMNGSGTFPGCKQGVPRLEPVQSIVPTQQEIENEYNRLHFDRSNAIRSTPEELGYDSLNRLTESPQIKANSSGNESWYNGPDSFQNRPSGEFEDWSDGSWGSSEFDEDENEEGYLAEADIPTPPTKPLPKLPPQTADSLPKSPGFLTKLKPATSRATVYEDNDAICLPVTINPNKHPPPELPPPPADLSDSQRKRRCVVDLTISSERSYIESLERIIQEYEKPILEAINSPKSHLRTVFREAKEILNHHRMFQIELSDTVKTWDREEKIGDIFTASFSKSMLVDAYSTYVNNFAAGMDEIRSMQQNRPNFEEMLKLKEKTSYDRLSVFGLMVKPVQRFPQFIMLLQDLIKYTPQNHHDRRALQLALTELENVTHKLNERKRLSEQYFQAKQTMQLLPRQLPTQVLSSRNVEKPRRLIRFDNFDQIDGEMENMKLSSRRLILLDDMLVCVKVGLKDQDGFMMERYRLKWAARLCDVELKDAAMTPDMRNIGKMDPNRLNVLACQLEKSAEDPFHLYAELRDMLHDLTQLTKIVELMKSLRRSYQGYDMSHALFKEITGDLQNMIQIKDEQLKLVNSCSIILVDNSRTDKAHYVMQTKAASVKSEWCVDFNMAKLALGSHTFACLILSEKQNQPGWDRSPLAGDEEQEPTPALFVKCAPVDVPRHFTKVKCAIPVFMPSVPQVSGLGVQHLWVCTSMSSRGQVSIVSLHNTRPALTESFKACDCEILCVELVPGCGEKTDDRRYLFSEDTVWMSNTHNEIVIFPLSSGGGSTALRDPLAVHRVPGQVTNIKFVDERLFCGLLDGALIVYSRNDVGEWCVKSGRTFTLGIGPVKSQLVVGDGLWIACGHTVHVMEIDGLKCEKMHTLSGHQESSILQMVCSGVGIWVAFHQCASVRLFHKETMENLQEMSVANIVNRVLAEKTGCPEARDCVVTCIAASTGLLWIGTSVGLIVTLPLPRLSDGVPLYRGRPSVAYHAHRGPVRFIIPVYFASSMKELHRNSSLRSSLRARPSMRNRKRELIETEGLTEDRLLSSGTELEASFNQTTKPVHKGDRLPAVYLESYHPRLSDLPEKGKGPLLRSNGRKFFNLKRKKNVHQGGSLQRNQMLTGPAHQPVGRNLSFRSELANRIKRSTLSRFQTQSMFDLRSIDSLEVKMLYENLLDPGDISDEDEDTETRNTASIHSECSLGDLPSSGPGDPDESPANSSRGQNSSQSVPQMLSENADDAPLSPRIATIRAHTMRKTSTSNAVMVLSGGDGYWDLHNGGNSSRNEDASLLFWIYKF